MILQLYYSHHLLNLTLKFLNDSNLLKIKDDQKVIRQAYKHNLFPREAVISTKANRYNDDDISMIDSTLSAAQV